MRRGSEAGGQVGKGRRPKALTSKTRNHSKAPRRGSSRAAGQEKEVVRLTRELDEALKRQAASSEVLRVIRSSHDNLRAVFEAVAENSVRLCDADRAFIFQFDGELLRMVVAHNASPELAEWVEEHPIRPGRHSSSARAALERRTIQIPDVLADPEYSYGAKDIGKAIRTNLAVPILKGDDLLGVATIYRMEVKPFTEKQIALLQSFADQAAIAIENARLITETREALERQTATAEVLRIINSSPGDLTPVFDTILQKAHSLCGVAYGSLELYDGEWLRAVAVHGLPEQFADLLRRGYRASDHPVGRAFLAGERLVHLDCAEIDHPAPRGAVELAGIRTGLFVPLRRDETFVGMIVSGRREVRPFAENEIALLEGFAAQAVIAIENARLLGELRDREAELRVTFDNMGDGVVMFDADMRLAAWNRNFQTILDLPDALLAERPTYSDYVRILAERGEFGTDNIERELSRRLLDTERELRVERTRPDGRVIEARRNPVPGGGFVLIYSDITERKRAEQAIRAARDAAETALRDLQAAQASLVHAQKMAALGQLTAGIAHEIKNPLNFVNNFAGLSIELLNELREGAAPAIEALEDDRRAEIEETIEILTQNLGKIAEHGRRADGIVKSMLAHSRDTSGERQLVEINALVEESLNLAYHGARAQDRDFNITLERDFDTAIAPIELVPQNITRVLLNLLGNGFYAANKQRKRSGNATFEPVLRVTTREGDDAVEIAVRDNGIGIAPEDREKLFQPFFTTKPTGEGTGLGLSISYEIVTHEHGGTITVDSELGEFTEFTVTLPRSAGGAGRGKPP